jgi:hypothetical protein
MSGEQMTKAKFEIGENEKHTIIVNASAFLKYIKIEVDDGKVVNESNFQPLPKRFQLDVGSSEKHHVEISAGPFSTIKLFVDGKEAQKT